jgi:hypothetical protein
MALDPVTFSRLRAQFADLDLTGMFPRRTTVRRAKETPGEVELVLGYLLRARARGGAGVSFGDPVDGTRTLGEILDEPPRLKKRG